MNVDSDIEQMLSEIRPPEKTLRETAEDFCNNIHLYQKDPDIPIKRTRYRYLLLESKNAFIQFMNQNSIKFFIYELEMEYIWDYRNYLDHESGLKPDESSVYLIAVGKYLKHTWNLSYLREDLARELELIHDTMEENKRRSNVNHLNPLSIDLADLL
jgi:hypothetical protein